jgi:hypothetical protein
MRRALPFIVVATLCCLPCIAAARKSWNQIRYVGGTVQIKTSRYDWNTTLTITADDIVVEIAPATVFGARKTVRIKPSKVLSLSANNLAWQRVAAVDGAQLPAKHPTLFGMLQEYGFFGLVYETDNGKRGALLLDSGFSPLILRALSSATGKPIENSP